MRFILLDILGCNEMNKIGIVSLVEKKRVFRVVTRSDEPFNNFRVVLFFISFSSILV